MLVSKHKLTSSKSLTMFDVHTIVNFKKFYIDKAQMPSHKKLR